MLCRALPIAPGKGHVEIKAVAAVDLIHLGRNPVHNCFRLCKRPKMNCNELISAPSSEEIPANEIFAEKFTRGPDQFVALVMSPAVIGNLEEVDIDEYNHIVFDFSGFDFFHPLVAGASVRHPSQLIDKGKPLQVFFLDLRICLGGKLQAVVKHQRHDKRDRACRYERPPVKTGGCGRAARGDKTNKFECTEKKRDGKSREDPSCGHGFFLPLIVKNTEHENVEDDIYPTKIGSDYYYLNEDGAMTEDDWINIDGEDYFFGKNGKMYRNGVYAIAGDNYLFESDGTLVAGDSHTELYDFKNSTYAVRADGTLVSGKIAKIDGYKYYFNSKGKLQSNKIIHVGKHNYYFSKNGVLVTNKKIKRNGKIYYSNKNGVLSNKK